MTFSDLQCHPSVADISDVISHAHCLIFDVSVTDGNDSVIDKLPCIGGLR